MTGRRSSIGAVALFLACTGVLCNAAQPLSDSTAQTWLPYDIRLTSTITYSNAYLDVDVNATFTLSQPAVGHGKSTGLTLTLPGFWDGGSTWVLRFAPPVPGQWSYKTSCNDTSNSGLHGQIGSFSASDSGLPGFLKASSNNRYVVDGTGKPFYWLGDTHWSGFSSAEHWVGSNDPNHTYDSMFKGMVQARRAQGYTVWKAETFANNHESGNAPVNDGGKAWINDTFFVNLNPGFWQSIDKRIQYVNEQGLVVSFAIGIGRSMPTSELLPQHLRLARYTVARYAAFNTVWITCQEYCANACSDCWASVASLIYTLDPYKRLTSMHNCYQNPIAYHNQTWYNMVTLQLGHDRVVSVDHWLEQYNAAPARPILEDEADYEQIIKEYGGGEPWMTRQAAWQSQVGGAFGFTYGGQGIWWACYDFNYQSNNCGPVNSSEYRVWYQTLQFEVGAVQLSIMKNIITSLPWWQLEPNAAAITWSAEAPTDTQKPYQKSTSDMSAVLAYLPQANSSYTGSVNNLEASQTYIATYHNPRNGTSHVFFDSKPSTGSIHIPPKPDALDWVVTVVKH